MDFYVVHITQIKYPKIVCVYVWLLTEEPVRSVTFDGLLFVLTLWQLATTSDRLKPVFP